MSDTEKLVEELNGIDEAVNFTAEAAEQLAPIPSMFRGMAVKAIISKAKNDGVALVDKEFVEKVNKERMGG